MKATHALLFVFGITALVLSVGYLIVPEPGDCGSVVRPGSGDCDLGGLLLAAVLSWLIGAAASVGALMLHDRRRGDS